MNFGACTQCTCKLFVPQYWRDHRCRDCFHAVMEHHSQVQHDTDNVNDTTTTDIINSDSSNNETPVVTQNVNVVAEGESGPHNNNVDDNDSNNVPHRDRVVKEILSSERSYVENMCTLIEVFLVPLRELGDISPATLLAMFSNIEEIVQVNKEMLSSLEQRISHWSPTQRIGDVLLDLTPFLKMYTSYTAGYDASIASVNECEKISSFREFLAECRSNPRCKSLNLRSFLIQPVQRIPRYNMLLADLIKHTDKAHVDHDDLCSALGKMKVVGNDINEAIRISENRSRVLAVQKSFVSEVDLIAPHRMYVREGVLTKVCRKSHKRWTFFLFTDVLLYASALPNGRYVFHRMIQLETCRLADFPDTVTVQNAFFIIGSQKSFLVFGEALQQKIDWMLDLTSIINKLREKRMTFRRGQSPFLDEIIAEAPVWVPDEASSVCSICKDSFTVIRRRHHCRACGELVCKACSQKKLLLPTIDAKSRVRVCKTCHEKLTAQQEHYTNLRDQSMQKPTQEVVEQENPEQQKPSQQKLQQLPPPQQPPQQKLQQPPPPQPPQQKLQQLPPQQQILQQELMQQLQRRTMLQEQLIPHQQRQPAPQPTKQKPQQDIQPPKTPQTQPENHQPTERAPSLTTEIS